MEISYIKRFLFQLSHQSFFLKTTVVNAPLWFLLDRADLVKESSIAGKTQVVRVLRVSIKKSSLGLSS